MARIVGCILILCLACLAFFQGIMPNAEAAQPDIILYKRVNYSVVSPGDQIIYSISFHNLGPQISPEVWINDTLPAGVVYVNDTASNIYSLATGFFQYSILAGNVLSLRFIQVPPRNNSFVIYANVSPFVTDGQVLTNYASMNYTSNAGKIQPEVTATATSVVSTPVMQLEKSARMNPFDPSIAEFNITVRNIGSADSLRVWANDSLPSGTTYNGFQGPPGVICTEVQPGLISCSKNNFSPGTEVWQLSVSIDVIVPPDATIVNWVFLNATDQDGDMLPMLSRSASLLIPSAQIDVDNTVDHRRAMPGSVIMYSIFYNNTGSITAPHVWINDTLPNGVSVISTSIPPALNISGQVSWYIVDVGTGVYQINFEVHLNTSLANGTLLTNQVTVDYFDAIGRKRPRSTDSVSTTVTMDLPDIRIVKTADVSSIKPGGQIQYTIYYNNTGIVVANTVQIEDLLPTGTHILAANPSYDSVVGNRYYWTFHNVNPGNYHIVITIRVDVGVQDGTELLNTASVTYTDSFDQVVGSNFWGVIVNVRTQSPPPPGDGSNQGLDPVGLSTIVALIILAFLLMIYIFILKRSKTVIDDVFLLHKDGLLIKHFSRRLNPDLDSDILGGMLIAVQNFVNESFGTGRGLSMEGSLDELKFGTYSILLGRGKYVVVAAVISGKGGEDISNGIRVAIHHMENEHRDVLEKWSGDMAKVSGLEAFIYNLMEGKYRKKIIPKDKNDNVDKPYE